MSENFPLFPRLTDQAQKEADALLLKFKDKMKVVATEVLDELYCGCAQYIESDSWANFRNELLDGLKNYDNKKIQGEYDFTEIRKEIFKQFKDEILKDLNQDLVKECECLKKEVTRLREYYPGR